MRPTPKQLALGLAGLVGLGLIFSSRSASKLSQSPVTKGPVKLTSHLSDAFFQSVDQMAEDFRARGANLTGEDFLGVFLSESGVKPSSRNVQGYGGLNGMGASERRNLGFTGTLDDWTSLTADQQLPYVRRFFERNVRSFGGGSYSVLTDAGRLYLMNFTPAYLKKPDDFVIFRKGVPGYDQNTVIDTQKKGYIEVADMNRFLQQSLSRSSALWNELRMRLERTRGNV